MNTVVKTVCPFVAVHSWALAKCQMFAKTLLQWKQEFHFHPWLWSYWLAWENCLVLLDMWLREYSKTQISHTQFCNTCHYKAVSFAEVSVRIMSIKAFYKIIGVSTSISHTYLISHLIFPATMWDRFYYHYSLLFLWRNWRAERSDHLSEVSDLARMRQEKDRNAQRGPLFSCSTVLLHYRKPCDVPRWAQELLPFH